MGMIAWVRKAVCGWGSLDCCRKVCVCVGRGDDDGVGVCGGDCVGEEGSVWVGQPRLLP